MAKILNNQPITPQVFDGMWVNQLQIILPHDGKPGILQGNLLPYDGQHLLATGGKRVVQANLIQARQNSPALDGMIVMAIAEVKRQAAKDVEPSIISVFAPDPAKPVTAQILFSDNTSHRIPDCFALAGTDPTFANVLGTVLATVAVLAGLQIQQ